jgi:hypothetical protein
LTSTIQDKLDKGRLLGAMTDMILGNIFKRLCQCQDKSIKEQLELGIRYLDLRVGYHPENGKFYTCHGKASPAKPQLSYPCSRLTLTLTHFLTS